MNKKRTKYTIIVQQAYVDGKVIEAKEKNHLFRKLGILLTILFGIGVLMIIA